MLKKNVLISRRPVQPPTGVRSGASDEHVSHFSKEVLLICTCEALIIINKSLCNQVKPIDIKNRFFERDLDKIGSNKRKTQLQTKKHKIHIVTN